MTSSTDSSKYKLCRDLPGQKGPIFEEWYKDFMDASGGEGDEDASWAQTFTGTDRRAAPACRPPSSVAAWSVTARPWRSYSK